MITTGRWSVTIPLCTSRINSSDRGDQLHSTRWSDISRVGTSRLLSERSIRIDATLAVNKPAKATPTTSTAETTSRPTGELGALLSPLKRVTQTFQRDSPHVSYSGFVPRSAKWSAVPLTIQTTTTAVRIFQTWWRFHAVSTLSKASRHDALSRTRPISLKAKPLRRSHNLCHFPCASLSRLRRAVIVSRRKAPSAGILIRHAHISSSPAFFARHDTVETLGPSRCIGNLNHLFLARDISLNRRACQSSESFVKIAVLLRSVRSAQRSEGAKCSR